MDLRCVGVGVVGVSSRRILSVRLRVGVWAVSELVWNGHRYAC